MAQFRYDGETGSVDPTIGQTAPVAIKYRCNGTLVVVYPPDQEAGFVVNDVVTVTDADALIEIRADDRFTEV